jgi:hypothetical protein
VSILRSQIQDDESSIDKKFVRTSTRTYLVEATPDLDANQVRQAFSLGVHQVHPTDAKQWVVGITAKLFHPNLAIFWDDSNPANPANNTNCLVWTVAVSYGPWEPLENSTDGDPINQPVSVRFEGVTYQEIVDLDRNGNPVVNSAGDYFDPPVQRDRTRPVIKISRNETTFNDSTILAYSDKINSDTFYSYPPRTLKLSAPTAEPLYSQEADLNYFRVNYELHYDPKTWAIQVLDQGYRQLIPTYYGHATTQEPILIAGQPASSPVCLDGQGGALLPPVDAADITVRSFDVYEELDFTAAFAFPTGLLH